MEMVTVDVYQKKYLNYKEQFGRLRKALAAGFHLEAIFIEYAIMEDRTESILRHEGDWEAYLKKRGDRGPSIDSKIDRIKGKVGANRKSLLYRYFKDDLLDRIREWKGERNRLIHALLKQQMEEGEIRKLAVQGDELAKELRNRATNFARAKEKMEAGK